MVRPMPPATGGQGSRCGTAGCSRTRRCPILRRMSRAAPEREDGPRDDGKAQPLPRPGARPRPAGGLGHMPRRVEVTDDAEAQARAAAELQNLQQELTTTRSKPSFGAALERAAQRVDRKQKAASAPFAADARH